VPKDPKRNIQSYQIEGGDLNEFEFQKSQSEMAEDPELPFTEETDKPNPTQAKERIAEVTAKAQRKVEKRKKRGLVKVGGRKSIASGKKSAKKIARKSAKKETTRAGIKKRTSAVGKRSAQKVVRKSAKKGATRAGKKKRASVRSRRQRALPNR
jgi:HJR/Mrr/RecB family endonuclease